MTKQYWTLLAIVAAIFLAGCSSRKELELLLTHKGVVWKGTLLNDSELKDTLQKQRAKLGIVPVVILCENNAEIVDLRKLLTYSVFYGYDGCFLRNPEVRKHIYAPKFCPRIVDVPGPEEPQLYAKLEFCLYVSNERCFVNGLDVGFAEAAANLAVAYAKSNVIYVICSVQGKCGPLLKTFTAVNKVQQNEIYIAFTRDDEQHVLQVIDEWRKKVEVIEKTNK